MPLPKNVTFVTFDVYGTLIDWETGVYDAFAKEAERELAATDKRRAAYVRRYFEQDWTDRRLYHMMINSCMGFDAMIQSAIDGAGLTQLASKAAS